MPALLFNRRLWQSKAAPRFSKTTLVGGAPHIPTTFLQCLSSFSSCRNDACLRHNVLGALVTWYLLKILWVLWSELLRRLLQTYLQMHIYRVNPFRTSLVFWKQHERTCVSGTRKLGGSWTARLSISESGKQTLANTTLSLHQFVGSVLSY